MVKLKLFTAGSALAVLCGACTGLNEPAAESSPAAGQGSPTPALAIYEECSAGRLTLGIEEQELPEAVAQTRRFLVVSAFTCDFEELGRLARAGAGEFTHSPDGGEQDPEEYWRQQEDTGAEPLADLVRVLALPPATVQVPGEPAPIYVWPAIASRDTPTEQDWSALTAAFDPERVEQMRRDAQELGGGYAGWRAGIRENGDWIYFVAGGQGASGAQAAGAPADLLALSQMRVPFEAKAPVAEGGPS